MAERTFEKSFIPQPKGAKRSATSSVANLVGFSIFGLVALLALGVFLYGQFVDSTINQLTTDIAKIAKEIDREELNELQAFDTRLKKAKGLLENHVAASQLLELVRTNTAISIQFESFRFNSGNVVNITGVASSFRDVAAQIAIFQSQESFQSAAVSALGIQQSDFGDTITFTIDATVDPKVLNYTVEGVTAEEPVAAEEEEGDDDTTTPETDDSEPNN